MDVKVVFVDGMVKKELGETFLANCAALHTLAVPMKAHRFSSLTALILVFLSAIAGRAEEIPNQLLTALDSGTISGQVDSSLLFSCTPSEARRALVDGLYLGEVSGSKHSRLMKVALGLFPGGTGYCELGEYDSATQLLTNFCRGIFTNRSNGIITGKFPQLHARFVGRVSKDQKSAKLRLLTRRGGHEALRGVRLERADYTTTYGLQIWINHSTASSIGAVTEVPITNLPPVVAPEPFNEVVDYGVVVRRQVVYQPDDQGE